MGVRIEFLRDWRGHKKGSVTDVLERGAADVLVNRRNPPFAKFVDAADDPRHQARTMVPIAPGLHDVVAAVTGKRKRA